MQRALTIAGSDSGGGAGIQADLKTFTVLGVYGMSVITSLTAQNTRGVEGIYDIPPAFVLAQFRAVMNDIGADAIKTGMLSQAEIVEAVALGLTETAQGIPLVLDPVMVSKSGHHLLQKNAVQAVIEKLFPITSILTPNAFEAEMLTGIKPESDDQALRVAEALLAMGPQAVLLKGGHRGSESCNDLFVDHSGTREWLNGPRLDQCHTHGTGCTLSSAIAAHLAQGFSPIEACRAAKSFIHGAIENASPLGQGTGPVNHMWQNTKQASACRM